MRDWNPAFIVLPLVLGVWELGSRTGALSPLYLPEPLEIIQAYRARLGLGALVTTTRAIVGYLVGLGLAYCAHFTFVRLGLDKNLDSQLTGARAVPMIAVLPLFVIWFGFSEIGRILIVVFVAAGFYNAPLHEAYRAMPRQWSMLLPQAGGSYTRYYCMVVLPATIATLAGPLRISLAIAFTMAIASEYIGAEVGIGTFLNSARITFNVPGIMLAIFLCAGIGIVMDRLLMAVYQRCVPWAGKQAKL